MSNVPNIKLNNGVEIPQFGFGVFQIDPKDTKKAALEALEVGYRHIDTAQMYGNEHEVGQAVRESGIAREDIFVTSKLSNSKHEHDDALKAFQMSLDDLDIEYIDLFLIHWPLPMVGDFVDTWRAMEKMYSTGRVRAIGVSNFQTEHLRRLQESTEVIPAVNQIEVNPYFTNDEVRATNTELGIATEAWSPIAQGNVLEDPVLTEIAERTGKSAAQVTLRWHIQRGDIVFPKSSNRDRMEENINIFDFELSDDDISAITGLNRDQRNGPNPDTFSHMP